MIKIYTRNEENSKAAKTIVHKWLAQTRKFRVDEIFLVNDG